MASPNNDSELKIILEFESLIAQAEAIRSSTVAKIIEMMNYDEEEEERKLVEELVREYDGSCVSAVPKECLKTIMLWTGFSSFVSTSFPIDMRGGEKPNWPPEEVVRVVFVFLAVAFYGSLLGLLMKRNFPKLSFYSGYVSLISLLFALGMIAFFTVMWVFERI